MTKEIVRLTVRLPQDIHAHVKEYMQKNIGILTESEAIRILIQKGLEKEGLI